MVAIERHIARKLDYTAVRLYFIVDEFATQKAGRKSLIDLKRDLFCAIQTFYCFIVFIE